MNWHLITKEIEKTLAKLVPGGPTTERSEFETNVLVYYCADRQGIESMKCRLASGVSSLIYEFKKEDMDDDFTAFVEKMYNDIPAKDDPLRIEVTVLTLERLWSFDLLRAWEFCDDSEDDSDNEAPKRIQALIEANEPSALEFAMHMRTVLRKVI